MLKFSLVNLTEEQFIKVVNSLHGEFCEEYKDLENDVDYLRDWLEDNGYEYVIN
jgi:hypothetical protein